MNRAKSHRRAPGLSLKLVLSGLAALAIAAGIFLGLSYLGVMEVDRLIYTNGYQEKLSGQKLAQMQEKIDEEGTTLAEAEDFWLSYDTPGVYYLLLIDDNDTVIYDSTGLSTGLNAEYALSDDDYQGALKFADGSVNAVIYGDFASHYYNWVIIISALMALFVFVLVFLLLIHRRLKYIVQLEREMRVLEAGDLSHEVTVLGRDELGMLAGSINDMRLSILDRQAGEMRAQQAGHELVAAMSHDLRTPLTALIGYLEILASDKVVSDEAQRHHYGERAKEMAYRIKHMSDELFGFALGELREESAFAGEIIDIDLFLRQAFDTDRLRTGEEICALDCDGEAGLFVRAEPERLLRVCDNLLSNLHRYADPREAAVIRWRRDGDMFLLHMENTVAAKSGKAQSSGLGLKNCESIVRRHGGRFAVQNNGQRFALEIRLPLVQEE